MVVYGAESSCSKRSVGAELTGANLSRADLTEVDMTRADLDPREPDRRHWHTASVALGHEKGRWTVDSRRNLRDSPRGSLGVHHSVGLAAC